MLLAGTEYCVLSVVQPYSGYTVKHYTYKHYTYTYLHFVSPVYSGLSQPPGKPRFTGVYRHTTNPKPTPAALKAKEQRSRHRAEGRNREGGFYPKTDGRDTAVP